MQKVSLKTMRRYPSKYAWRIAFYGFNSRGEVVYYLYPVKEALEVNPNKEWTALS